MLNATIGLNLLESILLVNFIISQGVKFIKPTYYYLHVVLHELLILKDLGNESLILVLRRFLAKRAKAELIISNNFKPLQSEDVKVSFLKFILERFPWC